MPAGRVQDRGSARARRCCREEYVPYLRDALDVTLAEAVERVERWIREAGWERDSPDTGQRA
jgi:hypothetical protein